MLDDLYPVTISAGSRRFAKARLFHRDGTVRVYVDSPRGVTLAAEATLVSEDRLPGRRITMEVETADGPETWNVARASGCGCGSRLKRYTVEEAWK